MSFDRGADYHDMKEKFIKEYKIVFDTKILDSKEYKSKINKLVYLNIAMIQLKNGSRVSEASLAFNAFLNAMIHKEYKSKVTVKISKSQAIKTNKQGEKFETKARFRQIAFPEWIKIENPKELLDHLIVMKNVKNNVLNYLLRRFEINSHTLRYSFINYAMTEKQTPLPILARFIGHANINQLVTYSSKKEADKLFDI